MTEELDNLVDAYSKLSDEDQVKELEEKIKTLIGILNTFNEKKELLLVSVENKEDKGTNLTQVFNLLCCLEEEIAKLLENNLK